MSPNFKRFRKRTKVDAANQRRNKGGYEIWCLVARKAIEIRWTLLDFPVGKDLIVTTPDEIARRGDLVGTVLRPALREGKVIYERSYNDDDRNDRSRENN